MTSPVDNYLDQIAQRVAARELPDVAEVLRRGRTLRRRRRAIATAAAVSCAALLVGGTAALVGSGLGSGSDEAPADATGAASHPEEQDPDLPGRGDVPPGGERITSVSDDVVVEEVGTGIIDLPTRPERATHIEIELRCLSAGTFTFGDGASLSCDASDASRGGGRTITLLPASESTTIAAAAEARWEATVRYVEVEDLPWEVNARGESYGVMNEHGSPDLVAVVADNGAEGYARSADLEGPMPSTPEEAVRMQEEGPGTREVPVYASDGVTVLGTFTTG